MKKFIRYILNIGFFLLIYFVTFGISVYGYLYSTGDAKPNAFFAFTAMASIFISYKLTVKFNRFVLKHLKSNDDSKVEEKKESTNQDSQSSSTSLAYFTKRKKNTVLFIILGLFNKVLIHFIFYPKIIRDVIGSHKSTSKRRLINRSDTGFTDTYGEPYREPIGEHLNAIFTDELILFIPAFLSLGFIVWYFNDKIKAK